MSAGSRNKPAFFKPLSLFIPWPISLPDLLIVRGEHLVSYARAHSLRMNTHDYCVHYIVR